MVCAPHVYIMTGIANELPKYDVAVVSPEIIYEGGMKDRYLEDTLYNPLQDARRDQLQVDNLKDSIERVVRNIQESYQTQEDTDDNTVYDLGQTTDPVEFQESEVASNIPDFSREFVNEVSEFIDSVVSDQSLDVTYDNNTDLPTRQQPDVYIVLSDFGAPEYVAEEYDPTKVRNEDKESEPEDLTVANLREDLTSKIMYELGEEADELTDGVGIKQTDEQKKKKKQELHDHQYGVDMLMAYH